MLGPELLQLFSKRPDHIKVGLDRIASAYKALNYPARSIPTVLIGGTNGKGSTSGFLWHLLAMQGMPTGLYTSPHLVHYAERIQVSHKAITDQDLVTALRGLRAQLSVAQYEELSFFEVTTLLAFILFQTHRVALQVLEVGMGGRWDATNCSDPMASVIVSLAMDHQNFLGSTLVEIAREKAGIMRPGRPLFLGNGGELYRDAAAYNVIESKAQELRCPLWRFGEHFGIQASGDLWIQLPGLANLEIPLTQTYFDKIPRYLRENFALAAAVFYWLSSLEAMRTNGLPADIGAFKKAVRAFPDAATPWSASLLGRFQRLVVSDSLDRQRFVRLDVCHNPDGVRVFREALLSADTYSHVKPPFPGLVSILADKDLNAMLDLLQGILDPLVLFRMDHARSLQPGNLLERHRDLPIFADFDSAWKHAVSTWSADLEREWVVCGSVLATGNVLEYFGAMPERLLPGMVLQGRSPIDFDR